MIEYIYIIENTNTGKFYVGRTKNPAVRKRGHLSELRRGVHGNPRLQASFNKHGENAFEFRVVDSSTSDLICQKEEEWFQVFECDKKKLYNCHFETYGGPIKSTPHTPESAAKISEAIKNGTRKYIFTILDERFSGASLKHLARKYGVGANTLLDYTAEWERLRGKKMPKSVQSNASKERVAEFVKLYKSIGDEALRAIEKLNVTRKSIRKYLPEFGIDFKSIRIDGWKNDAKQRALDAIALKSKLGCSAAEAIRQCGATPVTYYKYLKEI